MDAFARLPKQCIGELSALVVFVDDVHLEMDGPLCCANGVKPGRVILWRVLQQGDAVVLAERRPGSARECLVG